MWILACIPPSTPDAAPMSRIPVLNLFLRMFPLRGGAIQPWEAGKIPPDYYRVLGVPKTASQPEIRKAHKAMALKHHPDKNEGSAVSNEKFVLIQVCVAHPASHPFSLSVSLRSTSCLRSTSYLKHMQEAYGVLSSKTSRGDYDEFMNQRTGGSATSQTSSSARRRQTPMVSHQNQSLATRYAPIQRADARISDSTFNGAA
jgi:curved DNA-binding protein CbpA